MKAYEQVLRKDATEQVQIDDASEVFCCDRQQRRIENSKRIFYLDQLMDKLISEKDDFCCKRQKERGDLDAKEKQLAAAGKLICDLAIRMAKRLADVVQQSFSTTSTPKKARLCVNKEVSTWTEKVCEEMRIPRESEQKSVCLGWEKFEFLF